jgi:hypothetical protein
MLASVQNALASFFAARTHPAEPLFLDNAANGQSIVRTYTDPELTAQVTYHANGAIDVQGILPFSGGTKAVYEAAAPAPRMYSSAGSGLPFPNAKVAKQDTPYIGQLSSSQFRLHFPRAPNAFYAALGTVYVPPHVTFRILGGDGGVRRTLYLPLTEAALPYRVLTWPPPPSARLWHPRTSPLFYLGREDLPVRSQEQILRDSAFPCTPAVGNRARWPENAWGDAVPHP